ncbi:MAG: DNA-3-methyladenine glycosylase [Nitrososphaeria archaeon]
MLRGFSAFRPIPRSFFRRETVEVARDLIGALLVRRFGDRMAALRITEVEAYRGRDDPASHAYRGNRGRASIMYGEVGIAYIYLSYGINYCLNVTARSPFQEAGAVLIRAAEPVFGLDLLERDERKGQCRIASGPGNLTRAIRIDIRYNGTDMTSDRTLFFSPGYLRDGERIVSGPRIGISRGTDRPWRFYIEGNCSVSRL